MDAEQKPMRVGFGCTVYAWGAHRQHLDGIGYYSNELASRIPAMGATLYPVAFTGSPVKSLYGHSVNIFNRYSLRALASEISGLSFLGTAELSNAIDIFHAPDHVIPRFKGIPLIATLMDAIPLSNPDWANRRLRAMKNMMWIKAARWADHVVTISNYSKGEINRYFGIEEKRISVVPLGVDQSYFTRIDTRVVSEALYDLKLSNGNYFLCIGTLQPRKNLERVIESHRNLPINIRKTYPLVIVGRPGWGCEELVEKLKTLPSDEPVHWLGSVDEQTKKILLQGSTALVFASLSEGFGLPALEAFASAAPVITSNTTSLPEVVGDAAVLVDPTNAKSITRAMLTICQDPALAMDLRQKGLIRARDFSWDSCARQTMDVYRQLV